ncbi:MAG: type II toxin-antitoxin system VapC family toxin [Chloroflexi bacterium]|nr:type II toxin-antitoxin system VapC family toxin [Chloroflexota bacterium]MBI5081106.1 type II toxin-antitoxin system VapC family toxin [Chloroflexota bacterium]
MRQALIDTSAIYSLVVRADKNHEAARVLLKTWLKQKNAFVLADVVFIESMTLLKSRFGSEVALKVGRELRANPVYLWMALGADGERETWEVFQKYADKEWSYTDCALLALSQHLKTDHVFSFDSHFDQMSTVKRIP